MKAIVKTMRGSGGRNAATCLFPPFPTTAHWLKLMRFPFAEPIITFIQLGRLGRKARQAARSRWATNGRATSSRSARNASSLKEGDYVSAGSRTKYAATVCSAALDKATYAKTRKFSAWTRPGCFAEYFAVPESSVLQNDKRVKPEIACMQDPLGNAIHAALAGDIGRQIGGGFGVRPDWAFCYRR